jgi:hypothetical protein
MAWHLKKADTGEIFSDRSFEEILKWAHSAQINPMDEISQDGENWVLARSIPEFAMEWTVLLADGETYGPTNIGTLKEFLSVNLLRNDTIAHHIDGTTSEKVKNLISGKWNKKNDAEKKDTQPQAPEPDKKEQKPSAKNPKFAIPAPPSLHHAGPKIRDYHTQPLPIPAYLRIPPPDGVIMPGDSEHLPVTDTDPE